MADTSDTDGLEITLSSHDSALITSPSPQCEDGDRDQDNNNLSINLSVTASPHARRVVMDGDGDGAPSSSTDSSPRRMTDETPGDHGDAEPGKTGVKSSTTIKFDDSSAESTPRRSKSAHQERATSSSGMKSPGGSATTTPGRGGGPDLSALDMKASWGESSTGGGSVKGSPTPGFQEGHTGYKCAFKAGAGMLADPAKIAREREKEERVRQARERLMEERRKKLEELREQQRIAQENRERQLEQRRQKIEDLRRRDSERRAAVEERRRIKEETERARRESILQKAEERVARYEAWKAGGRKGGRGHVLGFGSATPRDICQRLERPRRSSSQSALGPRSPNGSDMGSVRPQRRALSACSAVRRHCCVDMNRMGPSPFLAATPTSSMAVSMPTPVRLRDRAGGGLRKQRPNSVATSMPSFLGGEPARSPRSKSSDRGGRDRSKARSSSRKEKSKDSLDKTKDGDHEEGKEGSTKEKKTMSRVSLSFFDRLATPKFSKKDPVDQSPRETPPKKDTPILRKSSLGAGKPTTPAGKDSSTPARRAPSRDSPRVRQSTGPGTPHTPSARAVSPANKRATIAPPEVKSGSSSPRVTPPPTSSSPSVSSSPSHQPAPPTVEASAAMASEDGTAPAPRPATSSTQDITAEEYKARLAEKRRQAREKAEREAEEERKRQEEERRLEEERRREEEEEERRQEEEALRLAEEARKAEQERLERAIEAEEKRKKEEAERLEAERVAKEEAERKAKEEAERLQREQQERARREEEERLQRKKKLEMIMKRVKPDAGGSSSAESSPLKTTSGTPTLSQTNSSQVSPTEAEEKPVTERSPEEEPMGTPQEGQAVEPISAAMMSSVYVQEGDDSPLTGSSMSTSGVVRSASSGDILDSPNEAGPHEGSTHLNNSSNSLASTPTKSEADGESSKPRFKSPLLQQLVENKGGNGNDSSTPKFKSPLLQNLLGKTRVGARMGLSASMGDLSPNKEAVGGNGQSSSVVETSSNSLMTSSMTGGLGSGSSDKELERQEQGEVDKDEDTSLHPKHSVSNGVRGSHGEDNGDVTKEEGTPASTPSNGVLMADSALGSSLGFTMGQSSQSVISNGHHKALNLDMDDSSISLHSVDESVGPSTVHPPSTVFESEEGGEPGQGDGQSQFEELIDLLDTSSSPASAASKAATPIIAFEETRRPDVTESLS